MASQSVVNASAPADEPPVFFEMGGLKAFIGPSDDLDAMSSSLQALLAAAIDILQGDYESLSEAQFGALYLLRQVDAGWGAMEIMETQELRGRQGSNAAEARHG